MFTEQPISQSEKNDNSDLSKDKTSESEAQSKNEKLIEQNKNPEIKPPIPPIQTPESESPPESSHTREEKNEDPPNLDPIDGSFVEEIIDIENLVKEDEYSLEHRSFMEGRYAETMKIFRSGELVKGKIVTINENGVAVDIGFKSEGSIPLDEFDNPENLNIGDEIEVCIDRIEDGKGLLALSKRKAEFYRIWEKINELYKSGEMIEAEITRRIKGGMVVDLFGIEAFLPGSQIDVHPVRDFDALVNAKMDFRIIKVNNDRKNVVLSHKVLVEESLREIREKVLSELEEGQVVEGVVKNITDFGVFVDLGGVDGLLHITDLSWGRVSHPSDVVNLDEKISVKVLNYDKEKQRISLGLKQLKEHHWEDIEKNYPINSKTKGKVVSIVKYGAFIELAEGVEGLVHISEMSWTQHIKHPSQLVNVADEIDIIVLNIDRDNRKISLGMKQVEEDPWEKLEQIYQPKTRHKGIVRDLVPFGAFVELEEGIDGLIHISDLSWTRKVRHPGEIVKKAQEIEIVVLNFDKNERRIALGYKQLIDDPWDSFEKAYPIRAHSEGSVIRVLEKGVVVMLSLGVEGFVPNSQLGKSLAGEKKKQIKEGDNIELEVIEFDKANHRIVLSHSLVERQKEKQGYRTYQESTGSGKTTIGDIVKKTSNKKDKDIDVSSPKSKKIDISEEETKKTVKKSKTDKRGSEPPVDKISNQTTEQDKPKRTAKPELKKDDVSDKTVKPEKPKTVTKPEPEKDESTDKTVEPEKPETVTKPEPERDDSIDKTVEQEKPKTVSKPVPKKADSTLKSTEKDKAKTLQDTEKSEGIEADKVDEPLIISEKGTKNTPNEKGKSNMIGKVTESKDDKKLVENPGEKTESPAETNN